MEDILRSVKTNMTNLLLFILVAARLYIVWFPVTVVIFIYLIVKLIDEFKGWKK